MLLRAGKMAGESSSFAASTKAGLFVHVSKKSAHEADR